MDFDVKIDWKFVAACGVATVGIIFAVKMDPSAVEKVSIHVIDTFAKNALAGNGGR